MVSMSRLATMVGGVAVAATTLFYANETLINGTREQAINGAVLITIAAFIAVVAYEDWQDARRNARRGDSRSQT